MFKKILIANRGEIALRIIHACRELNIKTVAVYSEADENSLHVRFADEDVCIGPPRSADSYLNVPAIISAAEITGADAIHPGYGFLSESAYLAEVCEACHIRFIGPDPSVIKLLGDKARAKKAMKKAGVPMLPGSDGPVTDEEHALKVVKDIGFPVIVKAVAGGGGRGMRVVRTAGELSHALRTAQREAEAAFGNGDVYIEKYLESPRHIEFQIIGDHHGNVVHLGERECSIQRRHQKVVEESPSIALNPAKRHEIAECAAKVARAAGYTNAGTIEFLLDRDGSFYFLEMNTRLQVEHPVTEQVTGIDLVRWQLRIAMGEKLTVSARQAMTPRAHAIECRIYAEDPDRGFMPAPGLVRALSAPSGPGVRDDRGVAPGFEIPLFYDSMIAKLIVWDDTRERTIHRLTRALDEYRVVGVQTTLPFFRWLMREPAFLSAEFDTTYLDRVLASRNGEPFVAAAEHDELDAAVAVALGAWEKSRRGTVADAPAGGEWRRAARREQLRTPLGPGRG